MRKGSISKQSGIPVIRPRNQNDTPVLNRISMAKLGHGSGQKNQNQQNLKRKRSSAERLHRVSLASNRATPNKFLTPNQNKHLVVPTAQFSRSSIDTMRSSIGGKSGASAWPLNEPSFKSTLIDKVLEFLINNQCELQVNRQMMRSPRGNDFVTIFTFIYSFLQPGFKISSRCEEEIPKILKILKYPTQIPKSSFLNVGSPHTWPSILAILGWHIDIIQLHNVCEPQILDFDDDVDFEELKFKSLIQLFHTDDQQEELSSNLQKYREIAEDVQKITVEEYQEKKQESNELVMELQNMNSVAELLTSQREKNEQLRSDKVKLIKYNEDLWEHISVKDGERAEVDANLEELKEQEKQVIEEINRLEDLKASQKFTAAELNRYRNHKSDMAVQMSYLENEKKAVQKQTWDLEMEISKRRKKLSELCIQYNSNYEDLHKEHQLLMERISINLEEAIIFWKTEISSCLVKETKKAKDLCYATHNALVESKARVGEIQDLRNNTECEKHKLECKQKRLMEEIQFLKMGKVEQEKSLKMELAGIGDKIALARRVSTMSQHELQTRLEEAQKELDESKLKDKEGRQMGNSLHDKICDEIRSALQLRNRNIEELNEYFETASSDFLKECNPIIDCIEKL